VRRGWTAALVLLALAPAGAQAQTPIPEGPNLSGSPRVEFEGAPVVAQPITVRRPPRHPFMAPNGRSNLHEDGWQTDTTEHPAPLGGPMTRTSTFYARECASITFDSEGRIVTICVGLDYPQLKVLEPGTLRELANMNLPRRESGLSGNPFTNFAGGGYFYLDHRDRAVFPTGDRHLRTVAYREGRLEVIEDIDLSGHVESGDAIISALPDWFGNIWFASTSGVVGRIDRESSNVRSIELREKNGNSIAVDDWGSVYITTDAAQYRFDSGKAGVPRVRWR
jgi:hypothetical protein